MKRAMTKCSEESAAPAQKALITNRAAAISMTVLRPIRSARRPAMKAPTAQPRRMAPTLMPTLSSDRLKALFSPSWVPLMTPES